MQRQLSPCHGSEEHFQHFPVYCNVLNPWIRVLKQRLPVTYNGIPVLHQHRLSFPKNLPCHLTLYHSLSLPAPILPANQPIWSRFTWLSATSWSGVLGQGQRWPCTGPSEPFWESTEHRQVPIAHSCQSSLPMRQLFSPLPWKNVTFLYTTGQQYKEKVWGQA